MRLICLGNSGSFGGFFLAGGGTPRQRKVLGISLHEAPTRPGQMSKEGLPIALGTTSLSMLQYQLSKSLSRSDVRNYDGGEARACPQKVYKSHASVDVRENIEVKLEGRE